MRRRPFVHLALLSAAIAVVVTAVAVVIPWLPVSASEEADRIDVVYWLATGIAIMIFSVVSAAILYSVWRFRVHPDDDSDGPPIHGHTGLEIVWTAIPTVLVTVIAIVSAIVLHDNGTTVKGEWKVEVTAQQFTWSFKYMDGPAKGVVSPDLFLAIDHPVQLEITSVDVLHSFWVPEFAQKQDAVPGRVNPLKITPNKLGTYPVICTELCGLGHALMRRSAIVLSQSDFAARHWAAGLPGGPAAAGPSGPSGPTGQAGAAAGSKGKSVFDANGCGGCHTLTAAGASGTQGPNLDKLPAEAKGAGQPLESFVRESIVNPSGVYRARLPQGHHADDLRAVDLQGRPGRARAISRPVVQGGWEVTAITADHDVNSAPAPPRPRGFRRLLAPGYLRCLWTIPLMFGFGAAIVVLVRWAEGWHPIWDGTVITTVSLVTIPLGFLGGIGGFDYWLEYAFGGPTKPEDHSTHGAKSWKDYFRVNTDHKVIGIQYVATTFAFFILGGLMALVFRAELAKPGMQYVDTQTFNGLVSVHATLMIFLFIIPVFAGLGNYVIPLMLGAPDMAFPRLNALSYWLLPIAGVMFASSMLVPGGPFATGWTGYTPLASHQPLGQVFFNMGVQWAGASSIMTALNFLVTIITMRAPGMTFWRMPLLVWANFTTSLLVVIATPFIAGSQFFAMFDRVMHTHFFDPVGGGYVLGYQHIFWFYSHPAVYIMMLPGFGIVSEVISTFARKPVFGYRLMAFSLIAILILGFSVWAHHMFVAGMAPWLRVPMMVTTLLIAVPTGIKVFSWLATMWEGRIRFTTPMLFALGFLSMFLIGGLSGVYLGSVPIDIHASDTYFIVAHIHYVLFGGSLFTIFAGLYYWFPKMTGRMYNERLGKIHFWLTLIFFNLTFFPMHYIGLQGMPRRVADYAPRFGTINMFISVCSFVLGASALLFLYNMITSWVRGPIAPSNPWRANSLEWQVSSPPPVFNFDAIPTVVAGPYEYGVEGARHAIMAEEAETAGAVQAETEEVRH